MGLCGFSRAYNLFMTTGRLSVQLGLGESFGLSLQVVGFRIMGARFGYFGCR